MLSQGIYTAFILLMIFIALFSYLNTRFIKLPASIGILVLSLGCSLLLLFTGKWFPSLSVKMQSVLNTVNFSDLLMHVMLSFLLFAGGLHVERENFRKNIVSIITFASISVVLSTFITGILVYMLTHWLGMDIPLIYCLIFGALISPTDPIAVSSILRHSSLAKGLQAKLAGESLLNDGVGIVLFIGLVEIAEKGVASFRWWEVGWLFLREAGGGILWGVLIGFACVFLLKTIDNYKTEIFITIAFVMGGYFLAEKMDVSGALSMVIAGMITGNTTRFKAMSETTQDYLLKFWELIDELLNALLFLLIGLEMLVVPVTGNLLLIGLVSYCAVVLSRWLSVLIPCFFLDRKYPLEKGAVKMLTWCALRGGISIALALSLTDNDHGTTLVAIAYTVVVLSILLQGSTIGILLKQIKR